MEKIKTIKAIKHLLTMICLAQSIMKTAPPQKFPPLGVASGYVGLKTKLQLCQQDS